MVDAETKYSTQLNSTHNAENIFRDMVSGVIWAMAIVYDGLILPLTTDLLIL